MNVDNDKTKEVDTSNSWSREDNHEEEHIALDKQQEAMQDEHAITNQELLG